MTIRNFNVSNIADESHLQYRGSDATAKGLIDLINESGLEYPSRYLVLTYPLTDNLIGIRDYGDFGLYAAEYILRSGYIPFVPIMAEEHAGSMEDMKAYLLATADRITGEFSKFLTEATKKAQAAGKKTVILTEYSAGDVFWGYCLEDAADVLVSGYKSYTDTFQVKASPSSNEVVGGTETYVICPVPEMLAFELGLHISETIYKKRRWDDKMMHPQPTQEPMVDEEFFVDLVKKHLEHDKDKMDGMHDWIVEHRERDDSLEDIAHRAYDDYVYAALIRNAFNTGQLNDREAFLLRAALDRFEQLVTIGTPDVILANATGIMLKKAERHKTLLG